VAPGRLTLELLETGFVDRSLQQRRRSLDDFKAIGVRLAQDDGLIEVGVQLAVDQGQGYGIARPMPVTDVAEWVRGYRFDVDPAAPRTPNGGLAGHVAWEHRVTALGPHPDPEVVSHLGACTLTSYLDRLGEPGTTVAHRELHDLALTARDGPEHRAAWVHLSALVCG
jgi:hypothetical protein